MSPKPRYDQLLAVTLDAIDTFVPPKEPRMSRKKAKRPTRAQHDRLIRHLAKSMNAGFKQIEHEINTLQFVLAAVIDVQGCGQAVLDRIQADKQTAATPSKL